ncbi:helix-turn-helix transcriptional regulator [Cytobacillus sp. S13-E01]|uniref:helix-turn-helix domain-containing protein n=1 Tax=Cytobacillus sp. S13-E01 TaxID=3031326 RepID=UPI0023D7ED7F|nr:helix-turn-helix transcriptional regulator [Cytobacillus sp. S13-E01]MDF0728271.1 helix-turn-helix transcriptional regulator [Cytobacillus sp. S13-E01]
MSISYDKLWKLAIDKKLNKTQLRDCSGITSATLARLSKNQGVSLEALERICRALDCEIGDIVEFIENKVIIDD